MELAILSYELRYIYAGVLYFISIFFNLLGMYSMYQKRMDLYRAIQICRLIPVVQAGRIR